MNRVIKCRVLVCAVLRRGDVVAPDGSFVLREGDRIFVTASTESLATLLDNLGFTDNYIRVEMDHDDQLDNQLIRVRMGGFNEEGTALKGVLV